MHPTYTEVSRLGLGASILLIAAGAILTWGVNRTVGGIDIDTIGVILMIVGGIGLLATLLLSSSMPWRRETVVERDQTVADFDDRYAPRR